MKWVITQKNLLQLLKDRWRSTLGLTLWKLNKKFEFVGLYNAKFYGKCICRWIFKKFGHLVYEISISKMLKLVKISKHFRYSSQINPFLCTFTKIWSKIPGFLYPDFFRNFRIRFFSRKKNCAGLRTVKLPAILTILIQILMPSVLLLPGGSWSTWKMQKTYFFGG